MTPAPKPTKKEKVKMTAREFREKYGSKPIITSPKNKSKKLPNAHDRFYKSSAWRWFSRYIKLKYSDSQGMVKCATSGVLMSISEKRCIAGHCIRVFESNNSHFSTAFDERNLLPQTDRENRYFGGRPEVMRDKIDQIHGEGTYQSLVEKSKQWKKYTDSEMKDIAEVYREKTYQRLKELGLKKWWK